jgi:hypothetical protein
MDSHGEVRKNRSLVGSFDIIIRGTWEFGAFALAAANVYKGASEENTNSWLNRRTRPH